MAASLQLKESREQSAVSLDNFPEGRGSDGAQVPGESVSGTLCFGQDSLVGVGSGSSSVRASGALRASVGTVGAARPTMVAKRPRPLSVSLDTARVGEAPCVVRSLRCGVTGPCTPVSRHSNVVILTTSNITERIDVAFVDRADIRQYIGPPSAAAIFKIYLSCLEELMKVPGFLSLLISQ